MNRMNGLKMTAMAAAVWALSACGGGGGGGDDNTQVDGSAIKGKIINADVELIELTGSSLDPALGKVIGSGPIGSTSAVFSLPVDGYSGGAVVVRVKGRPATAVPRTQVQCDFRRPGPANDCGNKEFGQFIEVDQTFVIESFLPSLAKGKSNRINATALTALLRARAATLLTGSNTRDAISKAISQINQIARTNVVTETPVDLNATTIPASATPDQVAYAALNAAVLSRAPEGATGQAVLTGAIGSLNGAFSEDNRSIPNSVVRNLAAAALDVLPSGQAGAAAVLMDLELAAEGDGNFQLPPQQGNATAIERARAFIADVRNSAQRYSQLPDIGESNFAGQIEQAGAFAGDDSNNLFGSLALLLAAVRDHHQENPAAGSFQFESLDSEDQEQVATATFTVANGITTARITGDVGDNKVDLTATFPRALGGATGATQVVNVSGTAQTEGNTGLVLTINRGTATVTAVNGNQPIEDGTGEGGENVDKAVLDLTVTLAQKGVSKPLSFEGVVGFTGVQCKVAAGNGCVTPQTLNVAATPTRAILKGKLSSSDGQLLEGGIVVDIPETSARKFNYDLPYSEDNFIQGSVVVSARGKVTSFPDATLTVSLESKGYSDTAQIPLGAVTVSLTEGSKLILRIRSENSAQQTNFTALTLENSSSVRLKLNNVATNPAQSVDLRGTLLVDDQVAGKVEQSSNGLVRVIYSDGSFESLFF